MTESPFGTVPFDAPPAGTFDAIFTALEACSHDLIGPMKPRILAIPLRDDAGTVTGGFWGCTLFQWLHVQLLFIPEPLRGMGLGSHLMAMAESEARSRGCIGAHLTSLSFQATPFYERLGYTSFGKLDDFPPGYTSLYLRKLFDSPAPDDDHALSRARHFAKRGEDEAARRAYVAALHLDPTCLPALTELGALAVASGHRSAARTAYTQAVRCHPGKAAGHVSLANLLLEDGDDAGARAHYQAALAIDEDFPEAHQGMARVLADVQDKAAELHLRKGFAGHAVVTRRYRGTGVAVPLLLLVAARGGNIPTRNWIDDRHFDITAIYADFHDPAQSLPRHALVVNAIGDADLCGDALIAAEALLKDSTVPLINKPSLVMATGRADNARRLACIPDVVAPIIRASSRAAMLADDEMSFPLLLRASGFHTGRHFVYVENRRGLMNAITALPGDTLLAIQYLDARGQDGMARKYRAMFIDGVVYPLHLAMSPDWKVHYFTAAMADNPAYRDEERRFLEDMPSVLGYRGMTALAAIGETMGLDYAGVDFALSRDGSVMVFEANATMVVNPPDPDPIWDYRRRPVADVIDATRNMLARFAGS